MERIRHFFQAFKQFWKKKHINQIIILIFSLAVLAVLVFFAYMASTANIQSLKDGLAQSTIIYDKDGDIASKISANRAEGVPISDVPQHLQDAIIAIEDHRFYEHRGFDLKGITRAFFKNLLSGRITGGGSTLTQQLTKNALLSPEQTYKRKLEEVFLAVEIEKNYKKEEILQMYMNQVYFGSGAWGVQNASRKYFGKDVQDITISEAAMLAGLLKAPSALNPHQHYDRAIERRNVVLGQMKKYDMISETEYKTAIEENIAMLDGGGDPLKGKYPYYVDAVLEEAISRYGLSQDEIMTRGYQIYTEMDQNLQFSLEKVNERESIFPKGRGQSLVQSGTILLHPQTGGIRALVGGRGEHSFRGFNRATQLVRQPGSVLKPLAVFTPALEEGYSPTSLVKDEKMTFGDYMPENLTKTYQGKVPMYEAVEKSLNLPAVWLLDEIGLQKGIDSLQRFGIPLQAEDEYLGIALGGMNKGVSPLQMAEAYSVFANEGKREDSHLITKIIGPTGNVIAEHQRKETKVTSKYAANQMTSMLLNVVETGTGRGANIQGQQIAGKTGSTQLPFGNGINGTKDQWFVGYTPNIVAAVWIGYDKTNEEQYLPGSSGDGVVPVFRAVMEESLPYLETESFSVKSVNTKVAETEKKEEEKQRSLEEKGKEMSEKLKKETEKWKEKLEKGKKDLEEKLKETWNWITSHAS